MPPEAASTQAPPRESAYRRALVIANPVSGRRQGESAGKELSAGLQRLGIPTELFLTGCAGDGERRARALTDETDLVVSVGGDGTLGEVLTGLFGRKVDVGVLPLGTGNALSADLKLPRDVDRALAVFTAGKTVDVDVARVNGRLSFLVVGVGPDAAVVEEVHRNRRGPMTQWAYLPATLRTMLRHRPVKLSVELDGEPLEGTFGQVLVSNTIHYGGLVPLCPGRVLDDGRFEVFLFRRGNLLGLINYALKAFLRRIPDKTSEVRLARTVRITSPKPAPCQIDGDPAGRTPVVFEVLDTRHRILVP
ncbi:MAG: diacylglycerol kinase family lipid kinase [Planctomycetota bacterium]|jgi:YegS/Rv2252/BmrU family lipid kinase|nr:diacylglycerol kinase family lipid kinase [Planctomycetota bacterium]